MNKSSNELLGFVFASRIRRNILLAISRKPMRPMELSRELRIKQQNISRCLIELEKERLVECLNSSSRAWRVYALTKKGKNMSKKVRAYN